MVFSRAPVISPVAQVCFAAAESICSLFCAVTVPLKLQVVTLGSNAGILL